MKSNSQFRDEAGLWMWAAIRLATGASLGLGVDEAHYALYGQQWALSYFDHPPLVGWVLGLFQLVLGSAEWVIRFPGVLAGTITSVLISRLLRKTGFSDLAVRVGLIALQVSPLFAGLSIMFLPDTLVILISTWILWILFYESQKPCLGHWLQLGLALGLLGLSKYTAIFVVAGLLLILLLENKRWKLQILRLAGAVGISILLVLPVLIWNNENDWISFKYQTSHVVGASRFDINVPLRSLIAQWVGYGLFLVPLGWWALLRRPIPESTDPQRRLRLWILGLIAPSQIFFLYSSLRQDVLPHWALLVHSLIIVAGWTWYFEFAKPARPFWKRGLVFQVVLLSVALIELNFRLIPFPDAQTPYTDIVGWNQIKTRTTEILESKGHAKPSDDVAIGVTNWTTGSRANFYLQDLGPVFVLDDRKDQFDLWENKKVLPSKLLMISFRGFHPLERPAVLRCPSWEYLGVLPIRASTLWGSSFEVTEVAFRWCERFDWTVPQEPLYPVNPVREGLGTHPGQEQ